MTRIAHALSAAAAYLPRLARRHTLKVWLLWSLAVLALVATPVALVDPAVLMLVLDPELIAAIVLSAAGMIRLRPGAR